MSRTHAVSLTLLGILVAGCQSSGGVTPDQEKMLHQRLSQPPSRKHEGGFGNRKPPEVKPTDSATTSTTGV